MSDIASALLRLQALRAVVADEYVAAIDDVTTHIRGSGGRVDGSQVVALLTERAARTDYIVLQAVLREMAEAVARLTHPTGESNVAPLAPATERHS